MTEFVPHEKGTILSIAGKIDHLHVICTRQFFYQEKGEQAVIAVNVSSIKEGASYDGTCVLRAGDHPFIRHDSYVRYKDAVAMSVEGLTKKIEANEISVLEDVSDEVFQRVFDGFAKSEFTKTKIKKLLWSIAAENENH